MKESKVTKAIVKILKRWEGSKLDNICAKEVFDALDKMGILIPPERVLRIHKFVGDDGRLQNIEIYGCEWENE